METMRVANVEAAIQLATQLKREGRYDWFRGQVRCWPLQTSQHPNLLFDFGRFARLFCRQIVPSQLAGGRSLTLFNPADLWRLGLP